MPNNFEFLIYNTAEGDVSVNAVVKDETIWLTQKAMAQLFDCSTDNISPAPEKHLSERRIGGRSNCRGFLGSSKRGQPQRDPPHKVL